MSIAMPGFWSAMTGRAISGCCCGYIPMIWAGLKINFQETLCNNKLIQIYFHLSRKVEDDRGQRLAACHRASISSSVASFGVRPALAKARSI